MKFLEFIVWYIIILPANALFALKGNQWWLFKQGPYLSREILLCVVVLAVFSYETGYKKCFLAGKLKKFYLIFIFPLIVTFLSFAIAIFKLPF